MFKASHLSWSFKGEGNANLVFAYTGHTSILVSPAAVNLFPRRMWITVGDRAHGFGVRAGRSCLEGTQRETGDQENKDQEAGNTAIPLPCGF